MANHLDRDQKSGLFLVRYDVFKPGIVGGYHLQLNLTVYPPKRHVGGEAVITQATAQPLVLRTAVHGHYEQNGSSVTSDIDLFLTGRNLLPIPQQQQQPHILPLGEDFIFDGLLKGGWRATPGSTARYLFLHNGRWIEEVGQDIQLEHELQNAHKALNLA
ncbi:DUF1842 domain-containing protein [Chromobacterium sp. IIBBL 290-4]|uniref:DUF1842 domain-containing protein n=1 Tax=Chromobacterium sp. IIBBL 290-4 TaxID=2953890 RepID=UPI0020B817C0|nr:DUF1842 domain-containing protein [Chromobacterium sp. IIBBL 290-4]UTH75246.1 DUF1842 domain-containing protein [Chromobacterium sp. IIBBL 290-4]